MTSHYWTTNHTIRKILRTLKRHTTLTSADGLLKSFSCSIVNLQQDPMAPTVSAYKHNYVSFQ